MEIRRMLVLSTAHLPERFFNCEVGKGANVTEGYWGAVVYPVEYGALMWVPDDPKDSSLVQEQPVKPEVLAVQLFAREQGCDYVLFDADAEKCEGLTVWEWGVADAHEGEGKDCFSKAPGEMCEYCRRVLGYNQKPEDTYRV